MTKGLERSLRRGGPQKAVQLTETIVVRDLAMTVDGATGIGFGTAVAANFPEGNILFVGAVAYLEFAGPGGDAGLSDTWAGDFGVGTTPASDATLTAGDIDLIDSTALAAATAEVSPRTRGVTGVDSTDGGLLAPLIFDNTASTLEINVSLLVDDADISADDIDFLVNGEIMILYTMMGDD